MRTGHRSPSIVALAASLLAAGCTGDAPTMSPSPSLARSAQACQNVAGTIAGVAIPVFGPGGLAGFTIIGTDATGPLAGTVSAALVVESVTAGGTIHFGGAHTFAGTSLGTITTTDKGTATPDGRIHDTLTLVGGATGTLQTHGTVDLATGALALRYHGRVCG